MAAHLSAYYLSNFNLIGFNIDSSIGEDNLIIAVDKKGNIEYLGEEIPREGNYEEIDLEGAYLSPGWIDMHTHIYHGVTGSSARPIDAGPKTGVLVPVDAGSSGEIVFDGFKNYVVQKESFPVKAFLNIGSLGTVAGNRISELSNPSYVDLNSCPTPSWVSRLAALRTRISLSCFIPIATEELGSWNMRKRLVWGAGSMNWSGFDCAGLIC